MKCAIYCRGVDDLEYQNKILTKLASIKKFQIYNVYIDNNYDSDDSLIKLFQDAENGNFRYILFTNFITIGKDFLSMTNKIKSLSKNIIFVTLNGEYKMDTPANRLTTNLQMGQDQFQYEQKIEMESMGLSVM